MLSLLLNCDSPVLPWQRRLAVQADEPAAAGTANASNLKKNAKYAEFIVLPFFFFLPSLVLDLPDFFIFDFLMH